MINITPLTQMNLPIASSPHGVAVVDADVLPLLDVHRCTDHHPDHHDHDDLAYHAHHDHFQQIMATKNGVAIT